jgi:methylenetetrahydrofolate dehydrogenase (NADP+)/methenyltetrahydrofolate cyclohydrolase
MTAQLIDGIAVSAAIRAELTERVKTLRAAGKPAGLAFVIVGENPASISYVRSKARACEETGLDNRTLNLPDSISQEELLDIVRQINADPKWTGMIVQLPLPRHIDPNVVALTIDVEKDADAMHPFNVGRMLIGMPGPKSCTPNGVVELLLRTGNDPSGKNIVIMGRSNIVGKPLAALLVQKAEGANATVTVTHTGTKDVAFHTLQADIVVAATGVPNALTADMIKPGAVVIDVGNNRVPDATRKSGYRMVGDIDFEAILEKASWVTPVPGGVGPMTVTMLLANTVAAAERAAGLALAM